MAILRPFRGSNEGFVLSEAFFHGIDSFRRSIDISAASTPLRTTPARRTFFRAQLYLP